MILTEQTYLEKQNHRNTACNVLLLHWLAEKQTNQPTHQTELAGLVGKPIQDW